MDAAVLHAATVAFRPAGAADLTAEELVAEIQRVSVSDAAAFLDGFLARTPAPPPTPQFAPIPKVDYYRAYGPGELVAAERRYDEACNAAECEATRASETQNAWLIGALLAGRTPRFPCDEYPLLADSNSAIAIVARFLASIALYDRISTLFAAYAADDEGDDDGFSADDDGTTPSLPTWHEPQIVTACIEDAVDRNDVTAVTELLRLPHTDANDVTRIWRQSDDAAICAVLARHIDATAATKTIWYDVCQLHFLQSSSAQRTALLDKAVRDFGVAVVTACAPVGVPPDDVAVRAWMLRHGMALGGMDGPVDPRYRFDIFLDSAERREFARRKFAQIVDGH